MGKQLPSKPTSATDKLQNATNAAISDGKKTADDAIKQGKETTEAAISETKKNVDDAKDVGAGYVEQVKGIAQSAISTAQVWILNAASEEWKLTIIVLQTYLSESGNELTDETMNATDKLQKTTNGAISQGKETADAAIKQGKETTDAALSETQKNVYDAKDVGAGYVEQVRGLAQSALDTAKVMVSEHDERGTEANHECPIGLPPRVRRQRIHRRANYRYRETPEDDEGYYLAGKGDSGCCYQAREGDDGCCCVGDEEECLRR